MGDRGADLASLRAELLGPEQRRLAALQARLDDRLARAEDLAEVLPTVLQQHANDPLLARALTPPLERAITASVQRNPKPLADALFPVMGPAIRKAVAAGLAGMVESLNRTLEHSLSWRSLRWRIEGWRTGKSFAEVLLTKTLLFRTEQVFLVDRKTGLLLQHVRAGNEDVEDADLVSGMLTAIRDFVRDSFKVAEGDSLESLKVGDLTVWIEAGPHATLAAVIRGAAPRDYRQTLQDALETIHLQLGAELETFDGDTRAFGQARPALESCLEAAYRTSDQAPRRWLTWMLLGLVILAALVWAVLAWQTSGRESDYVARLRAEPGLVVLSADHRRGRLEVAGLRDPLAADPTTFLADAGLGPDDVVLGWTPYYALSPSLVLARARSALRPPAGVELTIEDGVLGVSGSASAAWVVEARRLAPLVAGVTSFDARGAVEGTLLGTVAALEATTPLFVVGTARPIEGQQEAIAGLAGEMAALAELADVADVRFRVEVVGHTDATGGEGANLPLSQARAAFVAGVLRPSAGARIEIVDRGVGSTMPVSTGASELDKQRNRRVSISVTRLDGIR